MEDKDLNLLFEEHKQSRRCPSPVQVADFFNRLLGFLFPEYSSVRLDKKTEFDRFHSDLQDEFLQIIRKCSECNVTREETLMQLFWKKLGEIKRDLEYDIDAIYQGDPAAKSRTEVIRTYPGFYAVASYRIAHILHDNGYLLLSRMLSENAHSHTGIDIHPGAKIGRHFCIDHGTGIVIGETTSIGEQVKIYQGVTLGALSVRKEDAAQKRHPTIEDHVVIYAGASILGGETIVGHHSIIGGNVWLTESVPPWSRVSYVARLENRNAGDGQHSSV